MKKTELNIQELIDAYKDEPNLHKLAKRFHTSHIRISKELKENGVEIQNIGKKKDVPSEDISLMVDDYVTNHLTTEQISRKYCIRLKRLREIFRQEGVKISKWNGHIKKTPVVKEKKKKLEKDSIACPLCGWKTYDVTGRAHSFQRHLCSVHGYDVKTIDKYLKEHPEHEHLVHDLQAKQSMVQCKECGKWLSIIDDRHLRTHGMTKMDYLAKYEGYNLISDSCREKLRENLRKMNDNPNWNRFTSSYENEISDFLTQNGISHKMHDRSILNGLEIDILCGNIGIEFNGCLQHTEWFGGKGRQYHLSKTVNALKRGVNLIHIFEDEYVYHKDIVRAKILQITGHNGATPSIYARKCEIRTISQAEAKDFLDKNHIQGHVSASVNLGGFYDGNLVGVMSFKEERAASDRWELTRFATDINYRCVGLGGKLLKRFISLYNPTFIKSFADRRWTIKTEDNLYTKIGFEFDGFVEPTYQYYNKNDNKPLRFHKFGFRKAHLISKYGETYGLTKEMSETEMVKKLGYDRIWDCGLIRYVWNKKTQD